jgi:hypothetical protein
MKIETRQFLLAFVLFAIMLGILLPILVGCEPPTERSTAKGDWILVDYNPDIPQCGASGIYKKRCEKEHVTFYATSVHGGWSVSAVKD